MNEIQIFRNYEFGEVRAIEINGETWLVGSDVATALGYSNPQKAIRDHVGDEDKLTERIVLSGQNREAILINRSGVNSLVLASKLPRAKEFRHWITSEVIPSIQDTGAYMTSEAVEKWLCSPDTIIKIAQNWKEEKQKRIEAEKTIEENRPKVIFADAVSASKSSILIGQLAKLIKQNGAEIGQNRLFKWMRENGYLFKDKNEPTQRAMELRLFQVKERTINNPDGSIRITRTVMVTGKGQQYFINKFAKMGEDDE